MTQPTPLRPTVGAPSDEYRAVCDYSHRPDTAQCGQPATRHIRTLSPAWGEVALATCDRHAPIARAAGQFVAEHEYTGVCGFPATVWLDAENVCAIDDSGQEPAHVDAAQIGAQR
jgi:hypothetical protein